MIGSIFFDSYPHLVLGFLNFFLRCLVRGLGGKEGGEGGGWGEEICKGSCVTVTAYE